VIEPPILDLGQSAPGILKGTVLFRNAGNDTLRFEKISTNTGAMAALVMRTKLGAGDTTSLLVSYDGYHKAEGTFHKSITIETNEPVESDGSTSFRYYSLPVICTICRSISGCTRKND
jgi:hypothetical protein